MLKTKLNLLCCLPLLLVLTACPEKDDPYGKLVYMACSEGLSIIDVTDPAAPIEVGLAEMAQGAQDVIVIGDYAYVTEYYRKGFSIVAVENEREPALLGSIDLPDSPYALDVQDYYAFVGVDDGLRCIDISNPESPALVGFLDFNTQYGTPQDVIVEGRYAYVVDHGGLGLAIIDIDTPSNPVLVGSCLAAAELHALYLEGDHVYICENRDHGVYAVNVSDPNNPFSVGYEGVFGFNHAIYGDGYFLYVASNAAAGYDNGGLHLLTYGGDGAPYLYNSYKDLGFNGQDLVVKGEYAYVADIKGLRIMDIQDSEGIAELSFLAINGCGAIDLGDR